MAVSQNKLLPVLGVVFAGIIGVILYQQFAGGEKTVKPGEALSAVPAPAKPAKGPNGKTLPPTRQGDSDNASETLNTVVASNKELRVQVAKVLERNDALDAEVRRLRAGANAYTPGRANAGPAATNDSDAPQAVAGTAQPAAPAASGAVAMAGTPERKAPKSVFEKALDTASQAAETIIGDNGSAQRANTSVVARKPVYTPPANPRAAADTTQLDAGGPGAGQVTYQTRAPLGYMAVEDNQGPRGMKQTRYVRSIAADAAGAPAATAQMAAYQAAQQSASLQAKADEAYFTVPENATMTGVIAMTSLIGRVPIDGRVTDPMQFKAMIGRDNLAANGWELPDDLEGMIVSGIAIGDMALSCSEGKIRSLTFVFHDGTIRTVSNRKSAMSAAGIGASGGSSSQGSGDLGYISDAHGNPCIAGKFVTNAPAFLTDIVGLKSLGVAGQAYAEAQRTTMSSGAGTTSTVNNGNKYAMGQAVAGATDEVTAWMMSRLKNSFDAVVTPSGIEMVVHFDQEIRLDKPGNARKIIHRSQTLAGGQRGAHHGLE